MPAVAVGVEAEDGGEVDADSLGTGLDEAGGVGRGKNGGEIIKPVPTGICGYEALKKGGLLRSKGGPRIEKGGPEEVLGCKKGVPRRSAETERHRRTWAEGKNDGEMGQRDSAEGG